MKKGNEMKWKLMKEGSSKRKQIDSSGSFCNAPLWSKKVEYLCFGQQYQHRLLDQILFSILRDLKQKYESEDEEEMKKVCFNWTEK